MQITDIQTATIDALLRSLNSAVLFLPNVVAAIVILVIGVVVATVVHKIILSFFEAITLEQWLNKTSFSQTLRSGGTSVSVTNLLAEVVRWFIIIAFLLPAVETLGLMGVSQALTNVLLYIPNVLVAIVMLLIGVVVAKFSYDFVLAASTSLGSTAAKGLAASAKWSIMIFVVLVALSQLGIAQDLIRILFTGLVAMLAIAGGLAFGLGGQNLAGKFLSDLKEEFSNQ